MFTVLRGRCLVAPTGLRCFSIPGHTRDPSHCRSRFLTSPRIARYRVPDSVDNPDSGGFSKICGVNADKPVLPAYWNHPISSSGQKIFNASYEKWQEDLPSMRTRFDCSLAPAPLGKGILGSASLNALPLPEL